ncbi:phage tail protein [Bacillus sp. Xin]|uniref:phage tail spike protein n=1 Tax=unclassified Bacillus (in: firmicutes) TaxID=185979 RepID=UPI001571DB6E|nr:MULTISPECIES: phage tail spike protein [unclassified Bacillus (in: firmicutes)]MBC6973042.1 phage tail protein [Bacillus sp. Xin]NSW37689.1 phage tail protein [Bacillus sp. Xin1]
MITLYKPNETDFTHNGLGVLDAKIYDAEVEEILNGLYSLSFSYPLFASHGLEIEGMCIVKAPTPDGNQLFRIATPTISMGEIRVQCYHVFYDLTENLIEDIFIQATNGNAAMSRLSAGCQYKHPFTFYSDIPSIANARIVRKNPVEAILDNSQDNSFINRWGGELKRDNFDVKMLKNRGMDRGVTIQHKKDLLGYEGNVDWKSPVTRIMPKGFDGLLLPEKYVDSPNINKYPQPKIRVVEFNHIKAAVGQNAKDDDAIPLEEAYKRMRAEAKEMYDIQHVDQPKATYKVEFQELSQTEEYKNYAVLQRVWMGDTVTVKHIEDGIHIQAKVISYKYDPIKKEYKSITIGNYKKSFTDIAGKVDQMENEISNMPNDILNAAKEHATNLINSGFGGHVRIHPDRILIMDTKDEMTASRVWQWNINGFGYSSTGINGPYSTAITMDGRIVADFITAGTMNGNLIKGGEISGATLRTSDSTNYVHLTKQFIRLYESNEVRAFLGYYYNRYGVLQPTFILGGNADADTDNVLMLELTDAADGKKTASLGLMRGYSDYPTVYYASALHLNQEGDASIYAEDTVSLNAKTFNMYLNSGNDMQIKSQNNIDLNSMNGNMYFKCAQDFYFSKGAKRILSLGLSPAGETDLVFQSILLRNSSTTDSTYLQVRSGLGTYWNGVMASDFKVSSQKKYKTNIRNIQFSSLEKVMDWDIKQYNLKTDMEELYEMRMNRKEGDPILTTNDIPTHYGLVIPNEAEETGVSVYSMVSQLTKAFQEYVTKTDARIKELEPIQPKGNIRHRNKPKRIRKPSRRLRKGV